MSKTGTSGEKPTTVFEYPKHHHHYHHHHEQDYPHAATSAAEDHPAIIMTNHLAMTADVPPSSSSSGRSSLSLRSTKKPSKKTRGECLWPWQSKHQPQYHSHKQHSKGHAVRYLVHPVSEDSRSSSRSRHLEFDPSYNNRLRTERSRSGRQNALVAWHSNPLRIRNYFQDLSYFRAKTLVMQKRITATTIDDDSREYATIFE